jgi:hypothetical protein
VHAGPLYLGEPATPAKPLETIDPPPAELVAQAVDAFVTTAEPLPTTKTVERGAEEDYLAGLDDTIAPLTDLVSLPMDSSGRVSCPFHDDPNPSCSIYPDHYYCHACGARGTRLAPKEEAIGALQDWPSGVARAMEREPPGGQGEARLRLVDLGCGGPTPGHHRRALSRRNPRHRRGQVAHFD